MANRGKLKLVWDDNDRVMAAFQARLGVTAEQLVADPDAVGKAMVAFFSRQIVGTVGDFEGYGASRDRNKAVFDALGIAGAHIAGAGDPNPPEPTPIGSGQS